LHNVIILGASGAGKTYLACALGVAVRRNLFKIKYIRLPDLFILDEWLLLPLTSTEARDLLEIVEARHQRASTIFLSRFAPNGWHTKIGKGTLADAILDRIVHDSYETFIDGDESMRKRKGIHRPEDALRKSTTQP